MNLKIYFYSIIFVFALSLQSIFPTINSDITVVELIETNEDSLNNNLFFEQKLDALIFGLLEYSNSNKTKEFNDSIIFHNVVEVAVPPPRI